MGFGVVLYGIGDELNAMDQNVYEEMVNVWAEIIQRALIEDDLL